MIKAFVILLIAFLIMTFNLIFCLTIGRKIAIKKAISKQDTCRVDTIYIFKESEN